MCIHRRKDHGSRRTGGRRTRHMTLHSEFPSQLISFPRLYLPHSGFEPAPLAEQLSNHTPVPIPYKAPIDWARWGTFGGIALLFATTLRFVAPILKSRWSWAAGTVLTSLVMTSGYMFTRIRNAPFTGGNGQWIAPGYQNQFGQETQVIAMICRCYTTRCRSHHRLTGLPDGLLAAAFLMLTVVTPYTVSPKRQKAQVYLWSIVIFIMYSVLISLFKVKNRGTTSSSSSISPPYTLPQVTRSSYYYSTPQSPVDKVILCCLIAEIPWNRLDFDQDIYCVNKQQRISTIIDTIMKSKKQKRKTIATSLKKNANLYRSAGKRPHIDYERSVSNEPLPSQLQLGVHPTQEVRPCLKEVEK